MSAPPLPLRCVSACLPACLLSTLTAQHLPAVTGCRGYQQILPIGGYDAAYFEGATSILAQACGFAFPPCAAGEVAKPGGH